MSIFIVGNWKMQKNTQQSVEMVRGVSDYLETCGDGLEVVLSPSFLAMERCSRERLAPNLSLAAQRVDAVGDGSVCGGISAEMLREYCRYAFVGHCEHRRWFGDDDHCVNQKVLSCLQYQLIPIVCVGEPQQVHHAGQTETYLARQVETCLQGVEISGELVLLYEPVWSMGTGVVPAPEEIVRAMECLHKGTETIPGAQHIRYIYAGSVTGDNAAQLAAIPGVEGMAVGRAAGDSESFAAILKALTAYARQGDGEKRAEATPYGAGRL